MGDFVCFPKGNAWNSWEKWQTKIIWFFFRFHMVPHEALWQNLPPPPKRIKQNLFNTVSFETFQQSNPWFRYCMTPWIYKPYIFKKYLYIYICIHFFKYNFKFQTYTFTFFFTYLPPGLKMPCMMLLKGLPFLTRKFHPETHIHLVAICWVDLTGVPQ